MRNWSINICLWMCISTCVLHAQPLHGIFKSYTSYEGLPSDLITCMAADKQGFVWIGTDNGLAKFDGQHFINYYYNPADSNSLPGNGINAVACDAQGNIWVATQTGLARIDALTEKISRIGYYNNDRIKLPSQTIKALCIGKDDCIYLSCWGKGLTKINYTNSTVVNFPLGRGSRSYYMPDEVLVLRADNGNSIWASTRNGVVCFNTKTKKHQVYYSPGFKGKDSISVNLFFNVLPINDTLVIASTLFQSLLHIHPGKQTVKLFTSFFQPNNHSNLDYISGLALKDNNTIYVGSELNGLGEFDLITKKFNFYNENNMRSLSVIGTKECNTLFSYNHVLFAGFKKGLSVKSPISEIFNPLRFGNFLPNLYYSKISDIIYHPDAKKFYAGNIYVGGIMKLDSVKGFLKYIPTDTFTKPTNIYRFIKSKKGNGDYLLLTSAGIYLFNIYSEKITENSFLNKLNNATKYGFIIDVQIDNNSLLWVCTRAAIFEVDLEKEFFTEHKASEYITDTAIQIQTQLISDDGSHFIVDKINRIHYKFPGQATYTMLSINGKVFQNLSRIDQLYKEDSQTLWIATNGEGLARIDIAKNQIRYFTPYEGLLNGHVMQLKKVGKNLLAFTTEKSISVINTKSLLIKNYTQANGLGNGFDWWIGEVEGIGTALVQDTMIQKLDFNAMWRDTTRPNLFIQSVNVFDKKYANDTSMNYLKVMNLQHDENSITINYTCPDYNDYSGQTYMYMLDGLDNDYKTVRNIYSVSYTNLPPGYYTFKIKVMNSSDVWSDEKQIAIRVIPAYYQTLWFKVLIATFVLGLIYIGYRYRLQVVKREASLKADYEKRFAELENSALRAQMNPHFIFNCLNSINKYVLMNDADIASSYITKFAKLIRLILDNSRSTEVTLAQELNALHLYVEMEAMRFSNRFECKINIDSNLDVEHLLVPPLILQPFVENAIWHGLMHLKTKGLLTMSVLEEENELLIKFDDNGIGRKAAGTLEDNSMGKHKSHGMLVTAKRLDYYNKNVTDNIHVIDKQDENGNPTGTCVQVRLQKKYLNTVIKTNNNNDTKAESHHSR